MPPSGPDYPDYNDAKKLVPTTIQVLTALGDGWGTLPAPVAEKTNLLRSKLAADLPKLPLLQRASSINQFLQALAAMPEVAALVGAILRGGERRPGMRSLGAMVSDAQVQEILPLLKPMELSGLYTAEFYSLVQVPASVGNEGIFPVTARLSATKAGGGVPFVVSFPDNKTPVTVEVMLTAPGFREETDTWSRTVKVFPNRDSDLAVFALYPLAESQGERRMTVRYTQPLSTDGYKIDVAERKDFSTAHAATLVPDPTAQKTVRGLEQSVSFYTDVRFPGQVAPKAVTPLVVQLTREISGKSVLAERVHVEFDDPTQPTVVDVIVRADGFTELSGSHARSMTVYSFADSQPVIFLLRAGEDLGNKAITVDFYHKGRLIGSGEFITEITNAPAPEEKDLTVSRAMPGFDGFTAAQTLPADVALRITKSQESDTFQFMLHSPIAEVNRHFDYMGKMPLANGDPRQYLSTLFDELNEWAANPNSPADNADHQRVVRELEVMGERLFADLFSPQLKEAYWALKDLREQGVIRSLLITSDEPWIPWELVKPYDQRTGKSDDFLAGGWRLSRWLSGPGMGDALEVKAIRAVIPDLDLAFTAKERNYIEALGRDGVDIGTFLRTKQDVTGAASMGQFQLIHVAAHGNFKSDRPDESPIALQGRDELFPRDMAGSWLAALRKERPILFLNACHSAQVGFALTGLGGWANTAVRDMRVSAFIGGLWEVNDALAAEMAVNFYDNLRRDFTLGEAFYAARMLIRQKNPANSTWLAYSLYGDPNMKITWARPEPV